MSVCVCFAIRTITLTVKLTVNVTLTLTLTLARTPNLALTLSLALDLALALTLTGFPFVWRIAHSRSCRWPSLILCGTLLVICAARIGCEAMPWHRQELLW